ncbi:MAG: hypothetical protein Q8S03_10280 [Brevundimonas sp.]|uniref:hypothetical protein n=1 Tax=Brevundimonas sp. TaxID=1871086 RepID=UPI002736F6F6|nr:hypothetical protein [Brevundimonas sp.]MDP3405066.1 hypothetical protein [Brevundimonas sp.]
MTRPAAEMAEAIAAHEAALARENAARIRAGHPRLNAMGSAMRLGAAIVSARRLQQEGREFRRRLMFRGVAIEIVISGRLRIFGQLHQHLVKLWSRQSGQKPGDQAHQGDDRNVVAGVQVVDRNHSDLSVVLQSGDDAESSAGETSPTTEPRGGAVQ